jgi:hypothetical protein
MCVDEDDDDEYEYLVVLCTRQQHACSIGELDLRVKIRVYRGKEIDAVVKKCKE